MTNFSIHTLFTLCLVILLHVQASAQINWATATGKPLGAAITDGQVINNFGGTGLNVRINCVTVGGYPRISPTNGNVINMINSDNASFTLTALNGKMTFTLDNMQYLQMGEEITISNPDNKTIEITEVSSNGLPRMAVDGIEMSGALPCVKMAGAQVTLTEGNDPTGTAFKATMQEATGFTWLYKKGATGTSAAEGFMMSLTSVLPIELTELNAEVLPHNEVLITWETENETNNASFDVLHSTDARTWETISSLQGAGTTNQKSMYKVIDATPHLGINYYRLLQHDFDGTQQYSSIKAVEVRQSKRNTLSAWPNPVQDKLTVMADWTEATQLEIFNVFGQNVTNQVSRSIIDADTLSLEMSSLPRGLYLLHIEGEALKIFKD